MKGFLGRVGWGFVFSLSFPVIVLPYGQILRKQGLNALSCFLRGCCCQHFDAKSDASPDRKPLTES